MILGTTTSGEGEGGSAPPPCTLYIIGGGGARRAPIARRTARPNMTDRNLLSNICLLVKNTLEHR